MKIVIIQGTFFPVPPIQGGAVEKIWYQMGREFAGLGHSVTHISKAVEGTLKADEVVDGVHYVRVKGYGTPSSPVQLKLLDLLYTRRAVRKIPQGADVIVTNTFWAPIAISPKQSTKVYVSVERYPKGQLKWYKNAGRFRANSSAVAIAIQQELPRRKWPKIGLVPNPLPFTIDASAIDVAAKGKVVLYVGRIHPEKGIDILIRAFLQLKKRDWQLQIVGPHAVESGGGGADYFQKLQDLSAGEGNITFVGSVFDADTLNKHYREAAIFVYPSLADKGETFGLAPLEAMAWGCAPIVSGIACFRDFIADGKNGLIFDHHNSNRVQLLQNAMECLILDGTLRSRLSENAIMVNQTHSISHIASLFIDDFKKMVQ